MTLVYFAVSWPKNPELYHIIGVALTILSYGLWITARVQLGNAFTLAPEAKYLVKSGLYSKFRHPVYYFSILALIGLGLYIWKAYVIIPIGVLIVIEGLRVRREEAILMKAFSNEYMSYRSETWF